MDYQARYIAMLGVSVSSLLATALFVVVAFNPKDATNYGNLPWVYVAACSLTVITT